MKLRLAMILLVAMSMSAAEAKKAKSSKGKAAKSQTKGKKKSNPYAYKSCGEGKAVTTVYNLPQEDKPATWKGFKSFKAAVKMQGSGRNKRGNISRYTGKEVKVPKSCKTTTTSSSGNCLLSYFSIAADLKSGWRAGDIIYMRELADQEIKLPSGRVIRHPGFLIVHDTGYAIKGADRFDFFIGPTAMKDSEFNRFKFADKTVCDNKGYQKIERDSAQYHTALAQIYENQDSDTTRGGQQGDAGTQIIAGSEQ